MEKIRQHEKKQKKVRQADSDSSSSDEEEGQENNPLRESKRIKILKISKHKETIKSVEFLRTQEIKISDFRARVRLAGFEQEEEEVEIKD